MRRAIRLPTLKIAPVLPVLNEHLNSDHHDRLSPLPNIENKDLLFDCALVYTEEVTKSQKNTEQVNILQRLVRSLPVNLGYEDSIKNIIRTKFEEKLKKDYQLKIHKEEVLETINECSISTFGCRKQIQKKTVYVLIYAPFHVLLYSAENVRMKLPVEEIKGRNENTPTQTIDTFRGKMSNRWGHFTRWFKDLFYDDLSSAIYPPFSRTTVYSSANLNQFIKFFRKRNRSKKEIDSSSNENLWDIAEKSYFTLCERQWLIYELLARIDGKIHYTNYDEELSKKSSNLLHAYKYFGIDQLISDGIYDSYFPLHESLHDTDNERSTLRQQWASVRQAFKFQPLRLIRSYMGEKVAFYFAAMGFYTNALILPSIIGLIVFIYGAASTTTDRPTLDICESFGQTTNMCPLCDKTCPFWKLSDSCTYAKISFIFDNIATVIFAIIMSVWARCFVESWKRHEITLQYRWDSIDFDEFNEPIRPDFEKHVQSKKRNPKTGKIEPYINPRLRLKRICISIIVILFMVIIVCLTIFATTVYRIQMAYILKSTFVSSRSSLVITITSALINLITSLILSNLYYRLARKLTERESYKYQSEYEAAFSIKVYVFEFVNFYSSLFYIAYFKGRTNGYPSTYGAQRTDDFNEQCDPAGCMVELSIQLLIIMVGKQIIDNVKEYGLPYLRSRKPCRGELNENSKQWVVDNTLTEFDWEMLLPEYLEMAIQFGFVTLFVAAFPLAPLFALVNNLVEIRLDAWKFLTRYRRTALCKAANIGIWTDILSVISYLAVLTNAAVIAWTSEFILKLTYQITEQPERTLDNYVNWTLSSFPIDDYNKTGTMNPNVPSNLAYCRYRDFRESTGPNYSSTILFWHTIAGRLAFMLMFENVIYLIVYLVQLLIPDVPSKVQEDIDRQRYAEQHFQSPSRSTSEVEERIQEAKQKMQSEPNDKTKEDSTNSSLSTECRDKETNTDAVEINTNLP